MSEEIKPDGEMRKVADQMNLDRTEGIFESLIDRSKILDRSIPLDESALKNTRAVLASGNLHVKTAVARISALRFAGYRENMGRLKLAVEKKAREALRPTDGQ